MTAPDVKAPPYPTDTRARGWRFEVDMEKVKASDTWLRAKTGEVRGALLLLWGESWQQTPCGTLPADDELVALIIDMPLPKFQKNRAILMRGWWLAGDGRLYHETITERVLSMLEKRAKDAERSANRRARHAAASTHHDGITDASRVTHTGVPPEFDTKHQAPDTKHQTEENPPKPPRKRRGGDAGAPLVSVDQMVTDGVAKQHAEEWLAIRKGKSLTLTATAWDDVKSEAAKAKLTVGEAIRTSVVNSWGGFKAKWLTEEGRGSQPAPAQVRPNTSAEETQRMLAEKDRGTAPPPTEIREQLAALTKRLTGKEPA